MPKTPYYKVADSLQTYGTMVINNNWEKLAANKAITEEEERYANEMIEKKKLKLPLSDSPEMHRLGNPKAKVPIIDLKKEEGGCSEGSKICKKALRKRTVINYNEEPSSPLSNSYQEVPEGLTPQLPPKIVRKKKPTLPANLPVTAPPPPKQKKPFAQPPPPQPKPIVQQPESSGKDDTLQSYFELLAQREEEASKYLYSNPIIAQFTDPMLCFSEMCSLCGAFGNPVSDIIILL